MTRPSLPWRPLLLLASLWLFAAQAFAATNTVTISSTPPGVTSRVAPNIVVTFDDSGSMNATAIPDSMDANTSKKTYYSSRGNPIYFDPTVTYVVPPDALGNPLGTPTYAAAWRDGYCANTLNKKCWSPSNSKYLDPNVINLGNAFYAGFLANTLAGNSPCSRNANELNNWLTTGGSGNTCSQMDIPVAVRGSTTVSAGTCNPLTCGIVNLPLGITIRLGANPGESTTYNCVSVLIVFVSCDITVTTPDKGGFYYVCSSATDDTTCVYHLVANESTSIQQNFANWYSYYRTRNLNARAAVGRVFGSIADGSVRVAWQTLQGQAASGSYNVNATGYIGAPYGPLVATSLIQDLGNATTGCAATSTSNTCWRSQFLNWVYGAPASGGTPTRVATQVAGEFYKRKLSTSTANAQDPYWNGNATTPAELTCRKNFNMLVTDGYWNGDSPADARPNDTTALMLPDGTSYAISGVPSKIYWNDDTATSTSLADIAFSYWATDLRTDLNNNVPAYWADLTTGVTAASATVDSTAPGKNSEVYFNPANDPATWQHMSQYMVTMGISGNLAYPGDYTALRKGTRSWPAPDTSGGSTNIDDTWHAALDSRGGYFSAADPNSLVTTLSGIISSVIASSSTALTLSLSTNVLTTNAVAYYAGYDTTNWSGSLIAKAVGANGAVGNTLWSAGDLLTTRDLVADPRLIATSTAPGTGTGVVFAYANLSATEQAALNSSDGTGSATTTDNLGSQRVDWLIGSKALEGTTFRTRISRLGAVFGSQPTFVGTPTGGYSDSFPAQSPEAIALAASSSNSYAAFLAKWAQRTPAVYVGANDGMLHAFDGRAAVTSGSVPGRELWAYVPNAVYGNLPAQGKLSNFSFTPTVDGSPVTGDVFFNSANTANSTTAGWHTLLVGSLRLGGRGVFAIDVTDPSATAMGTGANVAKKVLWEFNSSSAGTSTASPANLGYTFGTPVITRVSLANTTTSGSGTTTTASNGRWVVLVPGGYFPDNSTVAAASNTFSSLFVLDAQTGTLLKEIRTPSGTNSHGLTTPAVGDYDGDQVADVAFAGDIDGNMWRIDLTAALAATPNATGVSLLFKPATANVQSVTTSPRLLADPTSAYFIVVFGTGRYLSASDTSDTTVQAVYGIRDPGAAVATPVTVAGGNLVQQLMTLNSTGSAIGITTNAVAAAKSGWYMLLNTVAGERVVVTPALDASNNTVTFSTLIPTATDPCTTSSSGSVFAVDGTTGGAAYGVSIGGAATFGTGYTLAGAHVTGAASSGSLYTAASLSGGTAYAAGQLTSAGTTFGTSIPTARRRSWRVLNGEN